MKPSANEQKANFRDGIHLSYITKNTIKNTSTQSRKTITEKIAIRSWGKLCTILKTAVQETITREKSPVTLKRKALNNFHKALKKLRENLGEYKVILKKATEKKKASLDHHQ